MVQETMYNLDELEESENVFYRSVEHRCKHSELLKNL